MTLDRTKKYRVGKVVWRSRDPKSRFHWHGDFGDSTVVLDDEGLLKLNPVAIAEAKEWTGPVEQVSYCFPHGTIVHVKEVTE